MGGGGRIQSSNAGTGDVAVVLLGAIWGRDGLPRKTRSLINLAKLTALKRPRELKLHVHGALRNGVPSAEIREVLMQAAICCGVPAALDSFRVAGDAIRTFES